MTELRSSVSVSKTNPVVGLHILQLIHESFLDKNYQTDAYWKVTDIKKIDVLQLEYSFQRRKIEMEQERNPEELREEYLFTCYKSDEHINIIAGQGLYVQQSNFNFLGDSLLGVILCKHADIQLKAAQNEYQPRCWLMIFKVVCGRKLAVHPAGNVIRKPTEGADCHVSSIPPMLGETLGCQAIKSQVYLYEADSTCVTGYSLRPRQCVPQAYVEFVSCSAPGTSLPPMIRLPYPGIIQHQRISSSLSLHTSASDLIPPNQQILPTGDFDGRDIQLTRPAIGLGQKYPPYIPKSSCLQNRKRVPVVSQPPNNLPTSSSTVHFNHLNWQQLAAGAVVGEGNNSTNRMASKAYVSNSGQLGWQQPETRPRISNDCSNQSRTEDNGLQVLLLNRTLVIELLQAFAKEMNTVAGVWKESGCNVETTSCLKNAVLAVQGLRALFMQIAPVCQQFYKFAQDLFSGKADNCPSLTVVQHQLKCLRKIQSAMSTAFKYFHEVAAQTVDSYQKGILMAQAVMSKQLLLLNCLTSLQGVLMAFNGFHANFSGVVPEEHAKQTSCMPDRPLKNSTGVLLLRQRNIASAAPETTSTLSPSLASLVAMSGGEIGQLSAPSRQESVNSVCIQNNRACEQSRNDIPCSSIVRMIGAERTMPCERLVDEAQSDLCLAETSNFGFRLPIVIAPDDSLVDEVLDMTSTRAVTDAEYLPLVTSIKKEKTTSRDKRSIIETIFIDADELLPVCIGAKSEEGSGDGSDRSSMPLGLVLDILDEKNPGTSLARVFCVSPDGIDESGPSNIRPCASSLSHVSNERQIHDSTSFEECSSRRTLLTSGNVDFSPDAKCNSFFGSSQSEGLSSVPENVEPEFVLNIEPTTEELSDSVPALSQNLNFRSQAKNSNSQIIADAEVVSGLSDDVEDTFLTCTEKDGFQLEKSFATDTIEVDDVAEISMLKRKCLRQKPRAFVKHKLFFIRKSLNRKRRSHRRKKSTMLNDILTIKPNSVKLRAGGTGHSKGRDKRVKETETADAGYVSGQVSNAEMLQMSETTEASMPMLKETDHGITENSSAADFLVAESQDSSNQDFSKTTCIPTDTCITTGQNDVAEKCQSLSSTNDSDAAKTSTNTLKSSCLITSVNANNSDTCGDEQLLLKNITSDICARERDIGSLAVCQEEVFADRTQMPLRTVKSEPVVTDFDLAVEQKPKFLENQLAVDDEIIAEVVANAAEFDGGNTDDSDDTGFLRIRIENVCSIAPEGFETMDYSALVKTESQVNVEESTENVSRGMTMLVCDVSVKPQSSFKSEDAHDDFKEVLVTQANDLASEVRTEDAGGTCCMISNSKTTREVASVAQPTSLIDASSSNQAIAKEQTCQEEEIVDVGDAEYSAPVGQSLTKASGLKDRIGDLVHGENFDDCDIEFDVLYENASDEDNDEDEVNDRSDSSKCNGNAADPELSDEVLKFYSLGGDNYETAEVHSTLDLMTLNVKTAPTGSTAGAKRGHKPVKKRRNNGSSGRKRRRKKRVPKAITNAVTKAVKKSVTGKLPIENQESELVMTQEKANEMVSECVVETGKKECTVEQLVSPGTQGRRKFNRRLVKESHINAFLVSADAEKLCCALPELGLDCAIATDLDGRSVNDESTDIRDMSECLESCKPDLVDKGPENLDLPNLDETHKADVNETELKVKANADTKEIDEKDLSGDQDVHQIENAVDPSSLETSDTTKTKKRKRRYAMTGRSKRRKRTSSPSKMCDRVRKLNQSTESSDTNVDAVEVSEQADDCKTDVKQPFCDEGKKYVEIPEAVLNLFVKGTSPVELPFEKALRTSPRRKAAVLCKQQPESVKPDSVSQRMSKLRRKRRTSSKAVDDPPEAILLDMLNDDKFLETVKSAVKSVERSSSVCGNSSEPAVKVGNPEEPELSVEESNPAYFTDVTSTFQHGDENNQSSNVSAEPETVYSEDVDYLSGWKPLSEEHLEVKSPGCRSVRTSSTPYSENGETLHCSGLDSTISDSSYSALINAVDIGGSSISFDTIRSALKTVASSKGAARNHAIEAVEFQDHTIESVYHDSVAQLDISNKGVYCESVLSPVDLLSEPKRAADNSARDASSSLGSGPSSAKTVIPLSVYLRNVRQSNYKIIKDTEFNNEPAFYTGVVVKQAADCPTHVTNQENHHNSQISSRDPRLTRVKQQSSVVQPLMQLETQFPSSLPRTVLAHYSSVQEFQEAELQTDVCFQSAILTSPQAQSLGSFPGYFHSFSNTENQIRSNPLVNKPANPLLNKPVCSITPFIHQSEKPIGNDQQGDLLPTAKQDVEKLPSKLSWDGHWQLIPISNLPPRPPIIFARLPLSERKIDGFLSDPRIRSERELSVRRQLSRPDSVCDDVPLVIDGDDASGNIKPRRSSGGVLSNAKFVSKESSNWEDTAVKAKDWFSPEKPPISTGDVTKRSLPENLSSQASKGKLAPADDILNDLLSSLHTESFEGERIKNVEAGMLCGLNRDRVLGKRSGLFPKQGTTSNKQQQQIYHSGVDGRSPVVAQHRRDKDNRMRDRDHKSSNKPGQITADVRQRDRDHKSGNKPGQITADVRQRDRDKRSLSKTSSHGHHTKDNLHSRRDQSSRKDFDKRESSRSDKDRCSQWPHVKPQVDVNSRDSAVRLIPTDPADITTNAEEKRPDKECIRKREHETESIDDRKRLKKSPAPTISSTRKDEKEDCNREDNLKLQGETKKEKDKLELKIHDAKTSESIDEALRRKKRLTMHSSQSDNVGESCLKQPDYKEHVSVNRDGRKSTESVKEKSCHKDMIKSRRQSQGSNGCRESLHGQDKEKHLHRREHIEKRRLSHGDVKGHTITKDVDRCKTSHSVAKVHEPIQSPTSYSGVHQNLASTADIRFGLSVDMEAKNTNEQQSMNCAVEQLCSNADTLSKVSGAGTLSSQNSPVDFTQADEEHECGSLVIHMEDDMSHLEPVLPRRPSCIKADVHNDLKISDANEPDKHCTISVSSCSVTNEALPSDEKKDADALVERNDPGPCKLFYDGGSCCVAPTSNTQIRADILKSIRSQKLRLEDKLKSDVDTSDVCSSINTTENNVSARSADGSTEDSLQLSNFSTNDVVGNLTEAEEKSRLFDESDPTQQISSSDVSTKSDFPKSSFTVMASVQTTELSVSSKFLKVSENASATTNRSMPAMAELQLEKSELIDISYHGRANCDLPFSADVAIMGLPSKYHDSKEDDVATGLSYVKQKCADNVAEMLEDRAVEDCVDDDWKQGSNVANVCAKVQKIMLEVQKTMGSEGQTIDITGICDVSDLIDAEPNTMISYGDSGEDKECLDTHENHRLSSAKCTPLVNCEQSALGIDADAEVLCISHGTEKLLEGQHEPFEPSHSSSGSCAVNTRKIRAADFFDDVLGAVNVKDLSNIDSLKCDQLVVGSYNKVMKTEPDSFAQDLQPDEILLESIPENTIKTSDICKGESFSDVAGPSCSSKPSVNRARRRSGKIADEWSNISSGWKELSRDYDEPAGDDVPGVVGTEPSSVVSAVALAAYKEVFKKEMAMTEQKIIDSCVFSDPCDGLTECQIKKLLRMNATNPEVEQELRLEYDILDLDKDVGKIQDCMEKIRSQLSEYRSPALDRTYDAVEQKFNFLLAKKEMYQHRLTTLRRYQKSHFVHVMPSEFLLDDEIEKYISTEGMLLFLHKPTISVQNCVRLAALKRELVQTRVAMEMTSVKQVVDLRRLDIKLRWLHLQRKVLLQQLCCTTEKGQQRLIQYLAEKLIWYKALQGEVDSAGDQQAEDDVQSFVWETVNAFESYIRTLQSVQKSEMNGRWMLDTTPTFRKRDRSRSSGESRNRDSADRSLVKKRRPTLPVNFDGCDFDQSTSSRDGWQKGSNTSFHEQEDPRSSEDGGERWSTFGHMQSNSEFEDNRSRYRQSQERVGVEDGREEGFDSRYSRSGGNLEDVWCEERKRRWECPGTDERSAQSSNMHKHRSSRHVASVKAHLGSGRRKFPVRVEKSYQEKHRHRHRNEQGSRKWYTTGPFYEDSSCSRSWSGQDYTGRCARGWLQNH